MPLCGGFKNLCNRDRAPGRVLSGSDCRGIRFDAAARILDTDDVRVLGEFADELDRDFEGTNLGM